MDILGVIALIAGIGIVLQIVSKIINAFNNGEGHITPSSFLVAVFCVAVWESALVLAIIAIIVYAIVFLIDIAANS